MQLLGLLRGYPKKLSQMPETAAFAKTPMGHLTMLHCMPLCLSVDWPSSLCDRRHLQNPSIQGILGIIGKSMALPQSLHQLSCSLHTNIKFIEQAN